MYKKRRTQLVVLVAALTATSGLYLTATTASAVDCSPASTVGSSAFEIDTDINGADLEAEAANCIDWLVNTGTRGVKQQDAPSGGGDDSFGEGTSEDDPVPTEVTGSIPPNKSDLSWFGVNSETGSDGEQFLQLFWSRVQNPKGTTNMDFELNQLACLPPGETAGCSTNGVTPVRTDGDLLITYELSKGGTVPVISIWNWDGPGLKWEGPDPLSATEAVGSVNRKVIPASMAGGIGGPDGLDPFTFGEASISFDALFPDGTCGGFGSAYLKSRSSDSFTAAIKDFITPKKVSINNCPAPITTAQFFVPQDTATVGDGTPVATGSVTFRLYGTSGCTGDPVYTEEKVLNGGHASTQNPGSGSPSGFVVNAGNDDLTYNWVVSYDPNGDPNVPNGDPTYAASSTTCGDESFSISISDLTG